MGKTTPWSSAQFLGRFCFEARKTGRSSSWRGNGRRDPGLRTPLKACGQSHRTHCSLVLPSLSGQGRSRTCRPTHLRSVSHATLFSPCPRASSPTKRNTNQSRCLLSRRDAVFPALSLRRWKHRNDNRLQGVAVGWVCVGGGGGDTGPPGAIATTQVVGRTKNPTGQSSTAVS